MNKAAILYRIVLFVTTTVYCCKKITAQIPSAWSYEQFNSSHGLPSSETIALAKDNKGFLWIGTPSGLSRYDGYQFHNYARTKDNELIGFVNVLAPDAQNRLWIGSDAGLFCYTNNEIIKISAAASSPQGVNDILPEKDGTIWLATENGPASIRIGDIDITGVKKTTLSNYILPQWMYKEDVYDISGPRLIEKATDGTVYVAQATSLFRLNENKTELVHHITNDRDQILSVFPVSKTKVFFNSVVTDIHKIENGIHANIQHKELVQHGKDDNTAGIWYLSTFGLYYFHPETAVVSRFINAIDLGVTWSSAMLKDDNFFWVASHDGLWKIKPSLFHHYNTSAVLPPHQDFYSFLQLRNGNLLVGSNRGNLLQRKDTGFTLLKKNIFPSAEIKCMYEDERGWLWMGSGYQGLVVERDNQLQVFTEKNGLHDNSFNRFFKATSGKLYAIGDKGMSEVLVAPGNTVSFKKYTCLPGISKHAKFFAAAEGPDGSIWIGGEEGVFRLLHDSLQGFAVSNKQVPVKDMLKDKDGNLWVATDGEGILKYTFNSKNELQETRQFTEKDGLSSLHYLSLLADKDNNIWAGSTLGLTFIGQQGKYKDRILNFDESDGFIKPGYFTMCLYQDNTGIIWAGTSLGFVSFRPDELFLSGAFPEVHITGISYRKKNEVMSGLPADNKFSYQNNSFNFGFVALDYANQNSIRYFYKLDGLDTNWVSAGSLRSVNYENLSPGKYSFHVKALNNKGTWSRQDAVYSFSVAAPFWKTWWFKSLLLLFISSLTVLLIKRRIQFIKKREAEKTELQKIKAATYQAKLETEQVINYFTASISEKNDIDDLLWDVAKNCISKLGFEDCVIYLADEEQKMLTQKAAWGPKTNEENKITNPLKIPFGTGITGSVASNDKAEIIPDTTLDKRYVADDANRPSEISVPVSYHGKVLGVIDSEHSQKNFYTEWHLHLLTTIATLLAERIVKIRAEQLAREKEIEVLTMRAANYQYQLETEQVTHFFSRTISQKETADEMLWDVSKNLIGKLGFEDCMIYLWNDDKTILLQKAGYGPKGTMQTEADKNKYHVPRGKGIVGAAAATKQNLLINDTSQDSRYFSADGKVRLSELCVPIILHDEVLGVINTEHTQKNFYTQRHLQILSTVASLLAEKMEKIKAEQQTREREMEVLKLSKDLATSQLTALRAQMNPHFLFNAMNSIQQFTLKNDVDNANLYISKFSTLLRKVLHSSQQNFISLEEEMEQLTLYLEIEKQRLGDEFVYTVQADKEIETDALKIPGMMVQPFVENALKHGLSLKEGVKKLEIKFTLSASDKLTVAVTDNGIGRQKANQIKMQQEKFLPHISKGIQLVEERLQLLSRAAGGNAIQLEDLYDPSGNPAGTKVLLNIPLPPAD